MEGVQTEVELKTEEQAIKVVVSVTKLQVITEPFNFLLDDYYFRENADYAVKEDEQNLDDETVVKDFKRPIDTIKGGSLRKKKIKTNCWVTNIQRLQKPI